MFKEATGVPPHRYITLQRIDHAKRLLTEIDLPLVDVAAAVGFSNAGAFHVRFSQACGCNPAHSSPGMPGCSCGERTSNL
jgi:AraC family transcriptional regulator